MKRAIGNYWCVIIRVGESLEYPLHETTSFDRTTTIDLCLEMWKSFFAGKNSQKRINKWKRLKRYYKMECQQIQISWESKK